MAHQLPRRSSGFTMLELLIVMTIIIVLAGLIIGTSDYVQKKGKRSRAEAEIAAMSAALESYKADNGIYPRSADTDRLDARAPVAADYGPASRFLYDQLAGASAGSRTSSGKSYFAFKPNMLNPPPPSVAAVTSIRDPFGNAYGYSTANQAASTSGYNPTFDLWSTANSNDPAQWIKNW